MPLKYQELKIKHLSFLSVLRILCRSNVGISMIGKTSGINLITDLPSFIKMMATALVVVNFIEKPLTHIQMGAITS